MRVLLLTDLYAPSFAAGGMANSAKSLAVHLAERDHKVQVLAPDSSTTYAEKDRSVKIIRTHHSFSRLKFIYKDSKMTYYPPIRDWMIIKKIENIIKAEKPDVIHAHGWITYSALPLKIKLGVPLVVTLHDYGFICPKRTLMDKNEICERPFTYDCIRCGRESYGLIKSLFAYCGIKLNKEKLKLVDKFIAVSPFVKEVYSGCLNLSDRDIVVIPNFYERENLRLKESGMLQEDFILFVGVLSPHKGVDVLIKAYNKINTKTKLVFIGAKIPDFSYTNSNSKNIITIENAPRELVLEAYQKCKFVVTPSIWAEPFGIVSLEAMAFKKPVIASNIGGLRDVVINNNTGILVSPNDSEKLANAMIELLSNDRKTKQMGINGYNHWIRHYTPDVVVPQIEEIYQELI